MGKITASMIPEILNNFNVYDGDGSKFIGITNEMSLAEFTNTVTSVAGAGIAGSYDAPVIGAYDSIKQEVPFRMMTADAVKMMNPMKFTRLNIRGAIQLTDKSTGVSAFAGFRYMIGGRCVAFKPGSSQTGNAMNSSVTIEATYVCVEVDGEKIIEIDKVNNIFVVNGVDLLEEVRKFC